MDDRLRALERAARASPDDAAAGHAYVRALSQAGESRGEWLELARLARAGDHAAEAALRDWRGSLAPLVESPEVHVRSPIDSDATALAGATRRSLILTSDDAVYLLDPTSLEETVALSPREDEGRVVAAPCGDEVLVAQGRVLSLRDRDGRVLATAELGGRITRLAVNGDRALVLAHRGNDGLQVFIVDLGAPFGRRLFTRMLERFEDASWAGRDVVVASMQGTATLHEVESGTHVTLDPAIAAFSLPDRLLLRVEDRLRSVDRATGRPTFLADEQLVTTIAEPFQVRAYALDTGAPLVERSLDVAVPVVPRAPFGGAIAIERGLVALVHAFGGPVLVRVGGPTR